MSKYSPGEKKLRKDMAKSIIDQCENIELLDALMVVLHAADPGLKRWREAT